MMDRSAWSSPVDAYCERTDAAFWAEPINALSNGAFLVAATVAAAIWLRRGVRDWPSLILILLTAVVGLGSFLFHTVATRWAMLADVAPILLFILAYFFLAMRRFFGLGLPPALAATLAFLALSIVFAGWWRARVTAAGGGDPLNGSAGYLPAAAALLVVGALLRARAGGRDAGTALVTAGGVFLLSLAFRTVDMTVCPAFATGTHFLWHLLNAAVLFVLLRAAILMAPARGGRRA